MGVKVNHRIFFQQKDTFYGVLRREILDPESRTRRFAAAVAPFLPVLPAFAGPLWQALSLSPSLVAMTAAGSGGRKKGEVLSEEEFERLWLEHLRSFPELADIYHAREIVKRIDQRIQRGESVSSLWSLLRQIQIANEDPQVRELTRQASEKLKTLYASSLELFKHPNPAPKLRDLKRGLRDSLEKREYDRAVDYVIALLRKLLRQDRGTTQDWLLSYPHPMVRSFVYHYLLSSGQIEAVRSYWEEYETTLFPQDIMTKDPELKRFAVMTLGPVIAAGGEPEWEAAGMLYLALETENGKLLRQAEEIIQRSFGEGSPLSYLFFCATNPGDVDLRFHARVILTSLVGSLEIKEGKNSQQHSRFPRR